MDQTEPFIYIFRILPSLSDLQKFTKYLVIISFLFWNGCSRLFYSLEGTTFSLYKNEKEHRKMKFYFFRGGGFVKYTLVGTLVTIWTYNSHNKMTLKYK